MRRILAIGGLLAFTAPLLVLVPSTLEPAYAYPPSGIGWNYHDESGSYYQNPASEAENPGPSQRPTRYVDWGKGDMASYACPTYEYDGSPFNCAGSENDPTNDFCNSNPGENGRPVAPRVIFEREFDNPQQTGNPPWEPLPPADWDGEHFVTSCHELPEDHVVMPEEIRDRVDYSVFQNLEGLAIDVHPKSPDGQNRTLVNLRTIVSTVYPDNVDDIDQVEDDGIDDQGRPYLVIEDEVPNKVATFRFTIRATADINWTFVGGNPDTGQGRGRAYDGTLPENAPPGHYVTTQFTDEGQATISLGAVWKGQVTVVTPAGPETHDIPEVVIPEVSEPIQASEAKNVIVD